MEALSRSVGHIKDIVAVQQNYASGAGFVEAVALADLLEGLTGRLAQLKQLTLGHQVDARSLLRIDIGRKAKSRPVHPSQTHAPSIITRRHAQNKPRWCG